jgi:hypothetical protein
MFRVAAHLGRNAVFHGDQHRAGIGTIVRTGRADYGRRHRVHFLGMTGIACNRTAKSFFSGMKLLGNRLFSRVFS